jgi:purine-binding chemotaxis protein CheW
MDATCQVLVFGLDDQRFALPLPAVDRVVRAVEITPLPQAPPAVRGVINLQGRIVPVFDPRRRFGRPDKELALTDHLIVARTASRTVALLVDAAHGILEYMAAEAVPADAIVPGLAYVAGVVRRADGIVLIHDLDRFLALDEAQQLEGALAS